MKVSRVNWSYLITSNQHLENIHSLPLDWQALYNLLQISVLLSSIFLFLSCDYWMQNLPSALGLLFVGIESLMFG